jgi:hypothetical protein
MNQIWVLRSRALSAVWDRPPYLALKNSPTDLRRRHHYMRDGALGSGRDTLSIYPDTL